MRKHITELINIIEKSLHLEEPIYEFGSLRVEKQEQLADLRLIFKDKKYIGVDYREGLGVDVIADIMNLKNIPDKSVSTVICCDTFEHIENPFLAIAELKRILKPEGIIIITTVMNFPIHNYPYDYWRYTPECLHNLLKYFKNVRVESVGKDMFPHTVIAIASMKDFNINLIKWKKKWHYQNPYYWINPINIYNILMPKCIKKLYRKT